jgi:hypothetical protein
MKRHLFLLSSLFSLVLLFTSCTKDEPADPIIPNEEEVITTLNFRLVPVSGGSEVLFSFKDLDGIGGDAPILMEGDLDSNQTYNGSIELLNELETPALDIGAEVAAEAEEHQFFYQSDVAGLTISYNDSDAMGKPIGLSTLLNTGSAGTGNLIITLRHEPSKDAAAVADGDITNAGGESDIEVIFSINVK